LAQIARKSIPDAAGRSSPSAGPLSHTGVRIEERAFRKPRNTANALGVSSPNSSRKVCMQNRNPIEVNILIVTIAQEGKFNRAAKKLGITPPSLTRRVASLERDIGPKLFARSTQSVVLAAAFA
jgi:hypothetical protein